MRKNLRMFFCYFVFMLVLFTNFNVVDADCLNISNKFSSPVYYSTYGIVRTGTNHWTMGIFSGSTDLYCMEASANVGSCYTATTLGDGNARVAGKIISLTKGKYTGTKQYMMIDAALNTYFHTSKGDRFTDTDGWIEKVLSDANSYYFRTNSLTKPTIKVSNAIMSSTSAANTFMSDYITVSNLVTKTVDGISPTYTISASDITTSGAVVSICPTVNSCSSSLTVSNEETKSFYVKVVGAKANDSISLKVSGSGSLKVPYAIRYTSGASYQDLIKYSEKNISVSSSNNLYLSIPSSAEHVITVYKNDEKGNSLGGASFSLDALDSANNVVTPNGFSFSTIGTDSSKGLFMWQTNLYSYDENDPFYNYSYVVKEIVAADGYVISDELKEGKVIKVSSTNSTVCYDKDYKSVDSSYCDSSNYSYMCKEYDGYTLNGTVCTKSISTCSDNNYQLSEDGTACIPKEGYTPAEGETASVVTSIDEKPAGYYFKGETATTPEIQASYWAIINNNGKIALNFTNAKNKVKVSKRSITGSDEISGASLKICSDADYKETGDNCKASKTVDNVDMEWESIDTPYELSGIPAGTYYIIEVIPPDGYKLNTVATQFSIDASGKVTTGKSDVSDNTVIVNNELNSLSVSKQDVATNKEVSDASLAICITYSKDDDKNNEYELILDKDGNCIPVKLSDGSDAKWISTNEPHKIYGLPAGTYYLVEEIAPKGYSTAESILFKMDKYGNLTDINGKSLKDNKLIMYDKSIEDVKTGQFAMIVISIMLLVAAVGLLIGYNKYMSNNDKPKQNKYHKFRKRKIRSI